MSLTLTPTLRIACLSLAVACTPGSGNDDTTTSSSTGDTTEGPGSTSHEFTGDPFTSSSTDPSTATTADSSGDTGMCLQPPVDEAIIDELFISAPGLASSVRVGQATALSLVWIDFGFPEQIDACVEWSIDPVDGVTIDASGTLEVADSVPDGTIVSVTADVESGRRIITADFEIYVPIDAPILGNWTELQQLPCDGGAAFTPDPIIGELVFRDTGEFSVTWTPFEIYTDYGGTFTYDEGTGALVLTVLGGNYLPDDIDGEGTASVVANQLVLEDMWLGVAQEPVTPVACGHVFE